MLRIYNSLSNKKEIFKPIHGNQVRLYVCGMTVYDFCHIGHARSMIVFDVIVRYFKLLGYDVLFVRNITDIDDKIIKRAIENQESTISLTERFIDALHEDTAALGLLSPDEEPKATNYIDNMISLITILLDKNFAYIAEGGDVYFDVRRFKEYGKLSHRNLEKLKAGVRIEVTDVKRYPLDFILWKMAKPGEPKWPSPWGEGRPGWHIECSAMSTHLLGQPFDIHGGGVDLKFPHHENEIAQSEAACQQSFANIWMHVGLLQVNNEKMSKSLGNYYTIRDVKETYHSETIRYFMLSSHYRSPVNYSAENLNQSFQALSRLYLCLLEDLSLKLDLSSHLIKPFLEKFFEAMNDDFNTPEALAVLFEISHEINRLSSQGMMEDAILLSNLLKYFGNVLGILQSDPKVFLQGKFSSTDNAKIEQLIMTRTQARKERNWQLADEVRVELQTMGITIEDSAEGTRWRRS